MTRQRTRTRTARLLRTAGPLALALAAGMPALLAPAAAHGQVIMRAGPGGPGFGPGGGARISRTTLDRYAKLLALDDAQRQAVDALHEAYSQATSAAGREMADKMREFEAAMKDGDFEAMHGKLPAIMEDHRRKSAELEKTFLDDIKAVLTPEQADQQWPRVERLRKREQWLRTGVLSGSNVDLTLVLDNLKLPDAERARLEPTIGQYEQDMDRLLTDVQRAHDDRAAKRAKDEGGRPADREGRRVIMFNDETFQVDQKAQREESARIKELNQRYARLLAADLPEDLRAKLEEQFKVASFRQIYRESTAERKLAAAEKFDDLTPTQRQRLSDLAANYRRQARAANDRWATVQERAEADGKATGGGGMGMMVFNGGESQPEDLREARQARRDLDKQFDSDLEGLLTPEQKDRLPKPATITRRGNVGGDIDVMTDGEHGAVFISAIETADEAEDGSGLMVKRSVIVTTDDPQAGEPEKETKKEEPKPK